MDGGVPTDLGMRSAVRRGQLTRASVPFALVPAVLVIGASTGGPQALTTLVAGLTAAKAAALPICVTLHMPAELMPVIATHVQRSCGIETKVVTEPCGLLAGFVYFSPGDRHLILRRRAGLAVELDLESDAELPSCRPAVDVMFASAAACLGARTLAVVLSGMGKDGLAGAKAIVAAGGSVLVQDKISSAVWGMPGAIAKAELAAAVLPPHGLAAEIARRAASEPRR